MMRFFVFRLPVAGRRELFCNECGHYWCFGDAGVVGVADSCGVEFGDWGVCGGFGGGFAVVGCERCGGQCGYQGGDVAFSGRLGKRGDDCALLCDAGGVCDGDYAFRAAAADGGGDDSAHFHQPNAGYDSLGHQRGEVGVAVGAAGDGGDEPECGADSYCVYPDDCAAFIVGFQSVIY